MSHNIFSYTDIAWCAGLYEGEGYIHKRNRAIGINMTDFDIIQRFHQLTGKVGYIHTSQPPNPAHKPIQSLRIYRNPEVKRLLGLFMPYLGLRRAYEALNTLDDIDGIYIAK